MAAPTVLFLGQHAPLLHTLRNQIGGPFVVSQGTPHSSFQQGHALQDVSMIVLQHDTGRKELLQELRHYCREIPEVPVVVFTADFSGSNARAFLKSGAADVLPLNTSAEEVLACYEAYLPGFKLAPKKRSKNRQGGKSSLLLATAATGILTAIPGLAPASKPDNFMPASQPQEQPENYVAGLDLKFLGFFSTVVNGRRVEFTKQAKLLFAYLAYNHPRAFNREHLARVFWPDKHEHQPESARRSLNVEFATIRKALRSQLGLSRDFVVFEKNHYRLDINLPIRSDVQEFRELCQQIQDLRRADKTVPDTLYQAVIQAYRGEFLEDCPLDALNWVEVERQHLSAVFEQMVEQYSAQLFQEDDFWKATAVCNEILSHDPNMEVIHRRLMQCYSRLGMGNKMEAQYKLLCQILKARFQSKPSAETERVYDELK